VAATSVRGRVTRAMRARARTPTTRAPRVWCLLGHAAMRQPTPVWTMRGCLFVVRTVPWPQCTARAPACIVWLAVGWTAMGLACLMTTVTSRRLTTTWIKSYSSSTTRLPWIISTAPLRTLSQQMMFLYLQTLALQA